jgi:hypothetical protein
MWIIPKQLPDGAPMVPYGTEFPNQNIEPYEGWPFYRLDLRKWYVLSGGVWTPIGGAGLTVKEADGVPSVSGVEAIEVDQATLGLIDLGGGAVSIDTAPLVAWAKDRENPAKFYRYFTHHLTHQSDPQWGVSLAGSGSSVSQVSTTPTRPGVTQLATGTTSTGRAQYLTNSSGTSFCFVLGQAGETFMEADIKTDPNLSDGTDRYRLYFGFGDNAGADIGANGIFWYYRDDVNGGKWQARARDNSVEATPVDSGITVAADTYYRLKVSIPAGGNSANLYIDDVLKATFSSGIPDNTRNLFMIWGILKSLGSNSRTCLIDWFRFQIGVTNLIP